MQVQTTSKQALTRRNATNSLYQYLGACIYTSIKSFHWQFLITKSKRSSKRMLAYFPIKKILDENGKTIFDDGINYSVTNGKLDFDKNGFMIEDPKENKFDNLKTSAKMRSNQLILMHLFNEMFKRKNLVDPKVRVECTKSATGTEKLTSKRLSSLPMFDSKSNRFISEKRETVEQTIGMKVHKLLSIFFQNSNKVTTIFIGSIDCTKESNFEDTHFISFYEFDEKFHSLVLDTQQQQTYQLESVQESSGETEDDYCQKIEEVAFSEFDFISNDNYAIEEKY
ncbi:hypothetical protein EDI_275400 [Entamoeba dispar SAW760]|uniref:Uncharacterized protein n=1 Tax=Entamoeba dispar (strain ATCC PRA-260 / SAW760) TaxID=370354 RepID=B0EKH7_ENTDS|nr:uncharacterized protein EDI_275400 [Entamoeba dispar SAW760]EDR24967.1 hypothetical protein EDI_275400 [Entamoeba dispar SAW760]|eukprot:EDR24967.1 hypothetical protein EDI_275400 [Entamoeba dispar SAW760]